MQLDLTIDAVKYINTIVKSDKISSPNSWKHVLCELETATDDAIQTYIKQQQAQQEREQYQRLKPKYEREQKQQQQLDPSAQLAQHE